MSIKQIARGMLSSVGLLDPVRAARRDLRHLPLLMQQHRYFRQLLAVYRHPLSRPREEFAAWRADQKVQEVQRASHRFETDRRTLACKLVGQIVAHGWGDRNGAPATLQQVLEGAQVLGLQPAAEQSKLIGSMFQALGALCCDDPLASKQQIIEAAHHMLCQAPAHSNGKTRREMALDLSPLDQAALVSFLLHQVIEEELFPHAYEYDYLDDIVPIIESRYMGWDGRHEERGRAVLAALSALAAGDLLLDRAALPGRLRTLLGDDHGFVPRRGVPHPRVREIIPDLFEEFIKLRANADSRRFLEINKEYSRRQATAYGSWAASVSLTYGYEQDQHIMLRTLIDLLEQGEIGRNDEVLIIGPRHKDEIHFFRKFLGLPNTVGLDLFASKKDRLEAGDMHAMHFESGRFKLVYSCGTMSYSYNIRKVASEIARVLKRPGYVIISDAACRVTGPDPHGRTDLRNADSLISCFYQHRLEVLFRDQGKSTIMQVAREWPSVGLRLLGA
jgi:hypothetical protein